MKYKTFTEVVRNDSQVHRLMQSGADEIEIIVALANEKERLIQQVIELSLIAPKRIETPDGIIVWHCPDHLIPTESVALNPSTVAATFAQP